MAAVVASDVAASFGVLLREYRRAAGLTQAGVGGGAGRGGAQPGPPAPADAPAAASDPNGAVTLFEAIDKQLGLKLQAQKRPVSILVIDHVEQKPIEN